MRAVIVDDEAVRGMIMVNGGSSGGGKERKREREAAAAAVETGLGLWSGSLA